MTFSLTLHHFILATVCTRSVTMYHTRNSTKMIRLTVNTFKMTNFHLPKTCTRPFHVVCLNFHRTRGRVLCSRVVGQPHHVNHVPKRDIHPLMLFFMKQTFWFKVGGAITGRVLRNRLTSNQKLLLFGLIFGSVGVWFPTYYYTHLETMELTGRTRFIAFDHEQLKDIFQAEIDWELEERKSKILPSNHSYYKTLFNVVYRILQSNRDLKEIERKWAIIIVDDDTFNAKAYPTGHFIVNTGVFNLIENEDQLAIIMGHEISHVLCNHAADSISQASFQEWFIIIVMTAIWAILPFDGIAVVTHWYMNRVNKIFNTLRYSRLQESEADELGLKLTAKACYDVREGVYIWRRLSLFDQFSGPEWHSTHPASIKRSNHLNKLLPEMLKIRDECKCVSLPRIDPRKRIIAAPSIENR